MGKVAEDLLLFAFGCGRCLGLFKLAAAIVGHVGHSAGNLHVSEVAAALGAHGTFALEGGVHEGIKALLDASAPSAGIAELGCASCTRAVAGHALGFIDFFASLERAVGIAHFNGANFLDALGDRTLGIAGAGASLLAEVT